MNQNKKLTLFYTTLGILGRLIPHPPNTTPFTSLCLFTGSHLSRKLALTITFAAIILGDALLACIHGYPFFSYWTIFTYSGFAAIVLISSRLKQKPKPARLAIYGFTATIGFWLWTNFGVWLTNYPHTLTGLSYCYLNALPFLRNSILGNFAWLIAMFGLYKKIKLPKEEQVNAKSAH